MSDADFRSHEQWLERILLVASLLTIPASLTDPPKINLSNNPSIITEAEDDQESDSEKP
ncbi:MAG: hypothetical protein K8L97_08420 [Anaerolineae bacterium]|nr:hypothetical protein [Anaerolineae bacterium]